MLLMLGGTQASQQVLQALFALAAFGSGTADHRFSEQTKQTEEERQVQHPIGRRREVASEILFVGQQQGRHAFMQLCWWHSGGLPAKPLDGADMLCGSLVCHIGTLAQARVNQYHTRNRAIQDLAPCKVFVKIRLTRCIYRWDKVSTKTRPPKYDIVIPNLVANAECQHSVL